MNATTTSLKGKNYIIPDLWGTEWLEELYIAHS